MKLNHKDVWTGIYRGIVFEIVNWGERRPVNGYDEKYSHHWNYYLYLKVDNFTNGFGQKLLIPQIEKEWSSGRKYKTYEYWNLPLIHNLDLHGGVTSFDILYGDTVRIGCDYGHLDDRPWEESVDSVSMDCKGSIDRLFFEVGQEGVEYLINCQGNGNLTGEQDGRYTSNNKSSFYSNKYIETLTEEQRKNWFKNEN